MTLRAATIDDLADIIALIRELAAFERATEQVTLDPDVVREQLFGDRPAASVLMIEAGGATAGFALWHPTFSTWLGRSGIWIEDLYVRPEYRRHGLGLAALQAIRDLTGGRVEWAVLDWNQPAIDFYEALGAKPVDGWMRYRLDPC